MCSYRLRARGGCTGNERLRAALRRRPWGQPEQGKRDSPCARALRSSESGQMDSSPADNSVTTRVATVGDDSITRLAAGQHAEPATGPYVLAERGDEPIAAVAIADGSAIAAPGGASEATLTLLR